VDIGGEQLIEPVEFTSVEEVAVQGQRLGNGHLVVRGQQHGGQSTPGRLVAAI
jgi:hypothetical protein